MNVLIVDDDHLVRKGIVSLMPWSEFGLQVVG
jgi:two-component system response regulator YesN